MTSLFLLAGLSAFSVNIIFVIIATVIAVVFLLALPSASKILFSHKQIFLVLLLFLIYQFFLLNLPTRRATIDYLESATYAAWAEYFLNIANFFIIAFLSGLMTKIILQAVTGQIVSIKEAVFRIKSWYGRAVLVAAIALAGGLINLIVWLSIGSLELPAIQAFWAIFVSGIFNTITFLLYPILIGDKRNLSESLQNAFTASIKTAPKWFHLFLALFILAGGFTYIFIPAAFLSSEVTANLSSNSANISDWNVHTFWLGGYDLGISRWYSDTLNLLKMPGFNFVSLFIFFVVSLIATLVKIKVTQILVEAGCLKKQFST